MLRNSFKVLLTVAVGCLLWSTSVPEAEAKGKNPKKVQKKTVVHKEVVTSDRHHKGHKVVVAKKHGRPPMMRPFHVVIPKARHVWVPGYWSWDRYLDRWVWIEGRYVRERRGLRYDHGRWVETAYGYRWVEPRWVTMR